MEIEDEKEHKLVKASEKIGSFVMGETKISTDKIKMLFGQLKTLLKKPKKKSKPVQKERKKIDEQRAVRIVIGGFIIFLIFIAFTAFLMDWIPRMVLALMIQFGYVGALAALIGLLIIVILILILYFATRTQDTEKEDIEF